MRLAHFVCSIALGGTPNLLEAHLAAIGLDVNAGHFSKAGIVLHRHDSGKENSAEKWLLKTVLTK
jgi:hypothetical protein